MKQLVSFANFILLVGVCAVCVRAQVPFIGACPKKDVVQEFDMKSYLGRWYEIEKYHAVFEADGTCIQAYYSQQSNGTIGVVNSQINRITRRMRSIQGTARLVNNDGSAKLAVRFPEVPFVGDAPYWVLDTDYKNYSIVWSCNDLLLFNFQIVWYLAREREPTLEDKQIVHDKMDELGLRRDLLQKTVQTKCDT